MKNAHLLLAWVAFVPAPMVLADAPPVVDADADLPVAAPAAPKSPFGGALVAVKVDAGVGDFTQTAARGATEAGPSWDVRGVFGAHSPVGVEAAYVGSIRALVGSSILNGEDQLVTNGAEGDLRVAAPITVTDDVDVRPLAFAGVGWEHLVIWGDPRTVGADDNILTIPVGLGVEVGAGPLNVDVRATYRYAIDSELFGDATARLDDPNALHSYNVSAGLGVEF